MFFRSIRNLIAYANEENIVNKDSPIFGRVRNRVQASNHKTPKRPPPSFSPGFLAREFKPAGQILGADMLRGQNWTEAIFHERKGKVTSSRVST